MTLAVEQWKAILDAVKSNYDSVLEVIKEELKKQDQDTYQEWAQKNFDINHQFDILLSMEDNRKLTLLHIAACNGHTEMVSALVKAEEIDVNATGEYGTTPLHFAASNGREDVVITLLDNKAKVDEKDANGWTPLHWAAFNGHTDVVTALLDKGANPFIKNKEGKTPRDLAKDVNIIQLLNEKASESQEQAANNSSPISDQQENLEKKNTSFNKSITIGSVCGVIAALAVSGGCFAAGVALPILTLIVIAVEAALVTGIIAGGITYSVSRPNDKLDKPDLEVTNQQVSEKNC